MSRKYEVCLTVWFGALSIVRTHYGMSAIHSLRTSAIVKHTRIDGFASSGTERDRRVHSVALHQARLTSTGVSLKQAASPRSALRSAETRAEIVCPVRLVDSHAPFSLATTPGGTSSVTLSGRTTSPRSFHIRTSMPCPRLCCAASFGVHQQWRRLARTGEVPKRRRDALVEDGEISIRGCAAFRSRQPGGKAAAPHRLVNISDLSSILPDGVAGKMLSKSISGLPSGPVICSALRVEIWLGRRPAKRDRPHRQHCPSILRLWLEARLLEAGAGGGISQCLAATHPPAGSLPPRAAANDGRRTDRDRRVRNWSPPAAPRRNGSCFRSSSARSRPAKIYRRASSPKVICHPPSGFRTIWQRHRHLVVA
jgi:hypothetical protein